MIQREHRIIRVGRERRVHRVVVLKIRAPRLRLPDPNTPTTPEISNRRATRLSL